MTTAWQRLCEIAHKAQKNQYKEKSFEDELYVFFLDWLGWSEKIAAIDRQYPIPFAHTTVFADIILSHDGQKEIVVELKRPTHSQKSDDIKQLFSYMVALKSTFGLYIGEKIGLYYDDPTKKREDPVLVVSYDFIPELEDGSTLLEYLQKDDYSSDKLVGFCKNQIAIKDIARRWNSEKGKSRIYQFILKEENLESSEFWAQQLESSLTISIATKGIESTRIPVATTPKVQKRTEIVKTSPKKDNKDRSLFSLDGIHYYVKSVFPIIIVRKLKQENPSFTYQDIARLFPKNAANNKALVSKEEWEKKTLGAQKRYHFKDKIEDKDGVVFYVSSQWGIEDYEKKVLPLLEKLGWECFRKEK